MNKSFGAFGKKGFNEDKYNKMMEKRNKRMAKRQERKCKKKGKKNTKSCKLIKDADEANCDKWAAATVEKCN